MSGRKLFSTVLILIATAVVSIAPPASAQRSTTCRIQLRMCQYDCLHFYFDDPEMRSICLAGCLIGYAFCD